MSMPSQSSEEGDRQQNRVKGDDRRARWTMKYFFGLMKEARTPFEVANVAFDERRYQDAADAYTIAISFRFDDAHKTLARRAESYLKLSKFREAYIDANEAVRFRNQRREASASNKDWLQRVSYTKAIALRHLGFGNEAFLNWEIGLRMGSGNADLEAEFRAAAVELCDKVITPTVSADFLTNYDPLESDSPEFGRELLLGDINRFILNGWQLPPADQDPLKFDFFTWRSVYSLLNFLHVESLKNREGGVLLSIREILEAHTLRLCFADTDWRNRASCLALLGKHEAFYLNAKKEYDVCLEHGNLGGMANAAATMATALKELGLVSEAKRALEPALRFLRLGNPHNHEAIRKYEKLKLQKDHPKIAFEDLIRMDPLESFEGDYTVEIVRKIRPAYVQAMEMLYGKRHVSDAPKPFSDIREGAPSEKILEVARAADAALEARDSDEACRLYTIAYHASGRCEPYIKSGHVIRPDEYVLFRGEGHLLNKHRFLECYIDACEAMRLSPRSARAYELKAVALCMMGYAERGKEVYKKVHELDPTYGHSCPGFDLNTLLGVGSPSPPPGYYDDEMLNGDYDPTLSDYYGDDLRLTASERKALKEIRDIEKARKCIVDGNYDEAVGLLNGPIESFPQPDVLTLRAKAYLGTNEPEKALKDAEAALRLDRVFYEATIISAKAHSALGNHGQARQALEEYLALGPDNDDVYQLWKSLEDKKCEPTVEEILDAHGIELPEYGPATLETAVANFTAKAARDFAFQLKRNDRYNRSCKQMLRLHLLQSVDVIHTRLRVVENEMAQKETSLKAAESKNVASAEENSRLKTELKAASKAKNQLEELKRQLCEAENATTSKKEKKLEQLLAGKEQELTHARQVYEALQQQNHTLKEEAERVKEERRSWKSHVKSTDELQQALEKAQQECAKADALVKEQREIIDHMQATEVEYKRKDMENRDIVRRLQRHNVESDAKIRRLEDRKESLEKQLTNKRVENSGLLSQLLDAIAALKAEEERHKNASQSGNGTTSNVPEAVQSEPAVSPPPARDRERLEAFKNGVYATLTGNVDGYTDMRTLLEHLREDIGTDGESNAREFGFESLEAFLRSTAMKDEVYVLDGEEGTVYKARPNATNRHQHEARVISAEAAARRRDRRAFFDARDRYSFSTDQYAVISFRMQSAVDDERNRANALAAELQEVREELRSQRRDTAELEKEARCQICMEGRPNQTTYVVRSNVDEEVACGHVSCDDCAQTLTTCPRCSRRIVSRIRFYL
ncbi:hypothetical protein AAVH_22906 [Aphelenchoides avenae]|nr:hypothetical protein AAVH_22906 [Aphelenchus avenae]